MMMFKEVSMRSNRLRMISRPLLVALLAMLGSSAALQAQEQHGWIGINFDDSNCRGKESAEGDVKVWWCATPPEVNMVYETGPAYAAGMRAGDLIVGVNGLDITAEEGGWEFANMRVGIPITFWVRRGEAELSLTMVPTSKEEAFGEDVVVWVEPPGDLDSLRIQMSVLYEGHVKLMYAMQRAEIVLRRTEAELEERPSEERQRYVVRLRTQIDSINDKLLESQARIRLYADSLAVRTMIVPAPDAAMPPPAYSEVVPAEDERAGTVYRERGHYSDVVAGARFEELDEESPLVADIDGVTGGLLIVTVVEGTPAHAAGLRQGDVVLAVNENLVTSVSEFRRLAGESLKHKREAEVVFVRQGKKQACWISTH